MMTQGNILFCGLGGQGVLLAGEITAHSLLQTGFDVKKSEVHGMAQRGGPVVAHLRYGQKVHSPLIDPGEADIEVAFEMIEAVRYLPFLHPHSRVLVNTQKIAPPAVATGAMAYPVHILDEIRDRGIAMTPVDAFAISSAIGDIRTVNMVMVGVLSCFLPVEEHIFIEAITTHTGKNLRQQNLAAFNEGRNAVDLKLSSGASPHCAKGCGPASSSAP